MFSAAGLCVFSHIMRQGRARSARTFLSCRLVKNPLRCGVRTGEFPLTVINYSNLSAFVWSFVCSSFCVSAVTPSVARPVHHQFAQIRRLQARTRLPNHVGLFSVQAVSDSLRSPRCSVFEGLRAMCLDCGGVCFFLRMCTAYLLPTARIRQNLASFISKYTVAGL